MTRNLFRETSSAPLGNVKSATGGRPLGSCGHILGLSVCGQWLRHLSGSFLQHFMVRQGSESHGGLACSMPLPEVGGWWGDALQCSSKVVAVGTRIYLPEVQSPSQARLA